MCFVSLFVRKSDIFTSGRDLKKKTFNFLQKGVQIYANSIKMRWRSSLHDTYIHKTIFTTISLFFSKLKVKKGFQLCLKTKLEGCFPGCK